MVSIETFAPLRLKHETNRLPGHAWASVTAIVLVPISRPPLHTKVNIYRGAMPQTLPPSISKQQQQQQQSRNNGCLCTSCLYSPGFTCSPRCRFHCLRRSSCARSACPHARCRTGRGMSTYSHENWIALTLLLHVLDPPPHRRHQARQRARRPTRLGGKSQPRAPRCEQTLLV